MANLILWRHADAEDNSVTGLDVDRALSKQGRKDARRMADWLDQFLPQIQPYCLVQPCAAWKR